MADQNEVVQWTGVGDNDLCHRLEPGAPKITPIALEVFDRVREINRVGLEEFIECLARGEAK